MYKDIRLWVVLHRSHHTTSFFFPAQLFSTPSTICILKRSMMSRVADVKTANCVQLSNAGGPSATRRADGLSNLDLGKLHHYLCVGSPERLQVCLGKGGLGPSGTSHAPQTFWFWILHGKWDVLWQSLQTLNKLLPDWAHCFLLNLHLCECLCVQHTWGVLSCCVCVCVMLWFICTSCLPLRMVQTPRSIWWKPLSSDSWGV